ncbi:MAG: hypothetical protein IJJ52_03215 [Lachnospiraceae bacterium]|nr:hypothetical protein [Lachnospiraceae bacterium]
MCFLCGGTSAGGEIHAADRPARAGEFSSYPARRGINTGRSREKREK